MRKSALAAFALLGAVLPALAQTSPPPAAIYIHAGRLIAEPGQPPQTARTIIVQAGRITAIEAGYLPPPAGARVIDLKARTVLPGLIDSHVHLLSELSPTQRVDAVANEESDWALQGLVFAQRNLEAGFTTVVDLGAGQGDHAIFALRDAFASGRLLGPRILAAGSSLSPTGGHGDVHGYRDDIMHVLGRESVCDGADACRRAVRAQVKAGADVIKVTATGGVLSNTASGLGQQFQDDELKAIADTAHALGRKATAHAHGKAGIDAALRAGFDSIEHGTYLDAETIALFRSSNACLVPTVLAGVTVTEAARAGGTLTAAQAEKALEVGPRMLDMLRRAREGGVCVVFGTDTGVSRHGDNAREFELMVQAGFTPAQALRAATVGGAAHVGLSSEIGTLAAGKAADIIAVDGDPLTDIATMRRVGFVMRAGRVAKGG